MAFEAVVDALEIEPVGVGVGIMSLLFRLTPAYASGSGPRSIILKMAPPYEQVRAVAAGYGFYEREVEIYRTLGDEVGLRPPALADRRAHERDLVRLYHDTLVAGGVTDYPFGELWDDYRSTILFCLSYAMGVCAVELANDRAWALAATMLERSIAAIIDLDADELAP